MRLHNDTVIITGLQCPTLVVKMCGGQQGSAMACRICGNSERNGTVRVREMMFGFRDEFTYFECSSCGCLQISEIPANMSKYYPPDYHPFQGVPGESAWGRFVRISTDRHAVLGTGLAGKALSGRYQSALRPMLGGEMPRQDSRILDVGCGAGTFLLALRDIGFTNLVGVDPYVEGDVDAEPVKIVKGSIMDLPDREKFDFVYFNHSLEHIWDQREALTKAGRLMASGGLCVVRMPVKTDIVWSLYGVHWVQIDAPRHFCVHTVSSFSHLARQCNLTMKGVTFDSTEFLFMGSEQYKRDIPLMAEKSYYVNPKKCVFTAGEIRSFRKRASELNKIGKGDQAAFLLAV
jgi:SAM-dependent methyltransferase